MIIAALASFAILLVAWIVAPSGGRSPEPRRSNVERGPLPEPV